MQEWKKPKRIRPWKYRKWKIEKNVNAKRRRKGMHIFTFFWCVVFCFALRCAFAVFAGNFRCGTIDTHAERWLLFNRPDCKHPLCMTLRDQFFPGFSSASVDLFRGRRHDRPGLVCEFFLSFFLSFFFFFFLLSIFGEICEHQEGQWTLSCGGPNFGLSYVSTGPNGRSL